MSTAASDTKPVSGSAKGGLVRDMRLVLVTAGFVSLFWLVVGGLLMGWLWQRPDDVVETPVKPNASVSDEDGDTLDISANAPAVLAPQVTAAGARLAIPVAGVEAAQLTDTYTDARGAGRAHDAIDIMAPAGTPVLAASGGMIEKLFLSDDGGKTIYVRSPDGSREYYYAHLQAYAPGLAEGQAVATGDLLGTVGSSGNADASAPHLHFAVNAMSESDDWYEGTPINPYPLLAGASAR
ncbi:M23 family metallopeptidase [Croceicoccus mobilis]|uniref:M23 family metallopeptidase n=1 Tax=Croceicoccus mobilis TaxID=1703339 RepID=UPI000A673970|nr:M23 family metallopeptidase [Croceicoccus mobilis]